LRDAARGTILRHCGEDDGAEPALQAELPVHST
jgi:hypothetical protein